MAITQAQIDVVKSTAPVLKIHGEAITSRFYKDLIDTHPELKNIFSLRNQANGEQPRALANAVLAYATFTDDLSRLRGAVERIAHKHASLYVQPEQYKLVGEHLLKAIAAELGEACTPEILDAWTAAYGQLAEVFIKRESQIYEEAGTWKDWRKFRIVKREQESDDVTSFYLEPNDGQPLPRYLPGQYISLQVPVPELGGITQPRQYSLSDAFTSNQYRISVKEGTLAVNGTSKGPVLLPGLISNMLHNGYQVGDELELSHPQGEFYLDVAQADKADVPLVLISAGVGATPLIAILNTVLSPESPTPERPIKWFQVARSDSSLVFSKHLQDIVREKPNVDAHVYFSNARDNSNSLKGLQVEKRLELAALAPEQLGLSDKRSDYFLCGPRDWMVKMRAGLESLGVEREKIRLELFATGDVEEN